CKPPAKALGVRLPPGPLPESAKSAKARARDRSTLHGLFEILSGGVPMSWTVEGTYFENCNCDFACPCTVTSFGSPGTEKRCQVVLAYHIQRRQRRSAGSRCPQPSSLSLPSETSPTVTNRSHVLR